MSLVEGLKQAASNADPEVLDRFLEELRNQPAEDLVAQVPDLLEGLAAAREAVEERMSDVREKLATTVAGRRAAHGFAALAPSTRGQRLDQKA